MTPLISCLMVTADRPVLLRRSLLAYRNQTWPHRELIVVDDGHTDISGILKKYVAGTCRHLRLKPGGGTPLGLLRNRALAAAAGEFITQWDDDDWYHPQRLAVQAAELQRGADACCLSHTLMHLNVKSFHRHPFVGYFTRGVPGSIMHRRNTQCRYPALRRAEDDVFMDFWRRRRFVKLPRHWAHLFIRCFHGANTWDRNHFMQQMRNTPRDALLYAWYHWIRRDLFRHQRFRLNADALAAFEMFTRDSIEAGIFAGEPA